MNNPYTLEPVHGNKFYGRENLIEEVLKSQHALIVGIWGMGKTSLLKHIEYKLCSTSNVGLYFSVDGVNTLEDFKVRFERACELKYESLRALGFDAGEMFREGKNVVNILATLDSNLRSSSKQLFLLVDGAGALAKLDVGFLKELRTSLRPATQIHLVLAATQEIYNLRDIWGDWPKSLTLSPLDNRESKGLIEQSKGKPIDTMVFIGFGLNDADFVGILRGLTATFKGWNREHYAILSYDPSKETKNDLANKRDELLQMYHIRTIFYDAPNHDHSSRRYILQCLLEDSTTS